MEHKRYKIEIESNNDPFINILDYLREQNAKVGIVNSYKREEGIISRLFTFSDGTKRSYSVYRLEANDIRYKELEITLKTQPKKSRTTVTMTAQGQDIERKLAEIIEEFNFEEI